MADNTATETNATTIASPEDITSIQDDAESKFEKLETEKENYRKAYLKEVEKNKNKDFSETDDERMKRIANEALAESRLAEIAREQDDIIKKALKENKELKLANMNRRDPSAAQGTHSESVPVKDTLVTQEQLSSFKARGWDDAKIERYKKNLVKNSR